jgi:hypothetical protein
MDAWYDVEAMLKELLDWLETERIMLKMWWLHKTRCSEFERTRQWFNIGKDIEPPDAYAELMSFVRQTVALSPRPCGAGAYTLVLAAVWPENERQDRWETAFLYEERESAYAQLASRIQTWALPPLAMMVGVLPYGALGLAASGG